MIPTEVGLDRVTTICSTRHPASVLGGIFVQWCRQHFSDVKNLEYNGENEYANPEFTIPLDELQQFIWNPKVELTKIMIQMVWDYNPENIQMRPGIFVKRNKQQTQKIAINNGQTIGAKRSRDGGIGQVRGAMNACIIFGSHTIFCCANSGAQAELVAAELFNEFIAFGPLIREKMELTSFQVEGLEEAALLEEFNDHWVVPLVITYAYPRIWRVDLVAPWLKTLSIRAVPDLKE